MSKQTKKLTSTQILLSNLFWGFILWLFGYILGFIFFAIVPPETIGYYIMPLGVFLMLWVLFQKIHRDQFGYYFRIGLFWTVMAVVLDYLFIVLLLNSTDYYKLDVYLYYALTFLIPVLVGWYKFRHKKS
ncbi:hypothetical protein KJ855_02420 [Patescibacteria group bacterium]|nr:hypothetical protein [Patescibacteria group bacterium]